MADAKPSAKTPPKAKQPNGIMRFLESPGPLGLPWFVWGVVAIGTGVAAFLWARAQNKPQADAGSQQSSADANALGLAIDPTTGLPYAVEGLVPSGGMVGFGDPYANEINQLQKEIDDLLKQQNPPAPSQQVGPQNIKKPPTPKGGGSITYPGGMTIPKGGLKYTVPKNIELEHIAEAAYGKPLMGDWTYIVKANTQLKGDTGETTIKKGKIITLPQVPLGDTIPTQ